MQHTKYIGSLRSALDVLNCFSTTRDSMSVSEIAQELGKNKGTVSKILSTLAAYDIVVRSRINNKYSIGQKIVYLASIVKSDLRTITRPYLEYIQKKNKGDFLLIYYGGWLSCLFRMHRK